MRNERKYLVISVLSFVLIALFVVAAAREFWRMPAAQARQDREYVELGAKLYAQNCIQCHGPWGEGVVGMPLNRKENQGHPLDPAFKDRYQFLYDTIARGRPGTVTTRWVKVEGKHWLSYSQMPPWLRENGGPMDEHMVKALTYFIMLGHLPVDPDDPNSPDYWHSIGTNEFPVQPATYGQNPKEDIPKLLPKSEGLTEEEVKQVTALLADLPKSMCLTCHTIGSVGGKVGPDLTRVGTWGLDEEFLRRWITNPQKVPNEERMPIYWSANRLGTGPEPELKNPVVPQINSYMPAFEGKLSDQEMNLIIRYLLGLK